MLGGQRLRNAAENLLARKVGNFLEHQSQQQQSRLVDVHMAPDRAELFRIERFRRPHPVGQQRLEHTDVRLEPGQAEIADLEGPDLLLDHPALAPLFRDEHIAGMQVLVHVARCMDVIERLQNIAGDIGNPAVGIQPKACDQVRQRKTAALDNEIEGVVVLEGVVDERDVRMTHDQELAQFVLPDAAHFAI